QRRRTSGEVVLLAREHDAVFIVGITPGEQPDAGGTDDPDAPAPSVERRTPYPLVEVTLDPHSRIYLLGRFCERSQSPPHVLIPVAVRLLPEVSEERVNDEEPGTNALALPHEERDVFGKRWDTTQPVRLRDHRDHVDEGEVGPGLLQPGP